MNNHIKIPLTKWAIFWNTLGGVAYLAFVDWAGYDAKGIALLWSLFF